MKRNRDEIDALLQELATLHEIERINPTEERLRSLIEEDRDGPLQFLNLLGFYDTARYPNGHEMAQQEHSGAAAYMLYGAVAFRHVMELGGQVTFFNEVEQALIGPDDDWDQIAIIQYPNTEAFIDMIRDPDYQAALVHRNAGLEKTVLLVSRPLAPGA
jgi:uncharacterized protein (DUF1330 family)